MDFKFQRYREDKSVVTVEQDSERVVAVGLEAGHQLIVRQTFQLGTAWRLWSCEYFWRGSQSLSLQL